MCKPTWYVFLVVTILALVSASVPTLVHSRHIRNIINSEHLINERNEPIWTLCPQAPTGIIVNNASITLDNSRNVSMTINAKVNEVLSVGSTLDMSVALNGGTLYTTSEDLGLDVHLPVQPGPFVFFKSVVIPGIAPSGAYTVDLTMSDSNGQPLTCVEVSFTL